MNRSTGVELRPVPGYEGLYSVTRDGRVWSHIKGIWRKPHITKQGYLRINLYRGKITHSYQAHRLVALGWIPNPQYFPCINHIDGKKHNNNVENLEWCTHSHNNKHAIAIGLHPGGGGPGGRPPIRAILSESQVREIKARLTNERGLQGRLGREYGVSQTTISDIKIGRSWSHVTV